MIDGTITATKRRNYRRLINPELVAVPARTSEYYAIYRRLRKEGWLRKRGNQPIGPAATLKYINDRCYNPAVNRYERYGGRGIKNYLSLEDLEFLWQRDAARLMLRPSIDRVDINGHYTLENCRYIEFGENVRRRFIKQCIKCGETVSSGIRKGKCANCRAQRKCRSCENIITLAGIIYCEGCRFRTKPCAWCGEPVRRDIKKMTFTDGEWVCSKKCRYKFVGMRTKRAAIERRSNLSL